MDSNIQLYNGDCLSVIKDMPDDSVDLVLTDPPYNMGVATRKNGKARINNWDRIDNYVEWCITWLMECQRVLKPTGVLYFWHNNIEQIAELLEAIRKSTSLDFKSFCIWDKGDAYRAKSWKNRNPAGKSALRSWFNVCEYCLHFFNNPEGAGRAKQTGNDRIRSNPECFKPLKEWYANEKNRLGLSNMDIAEKYTEVTGKKPYMLHHYFKDNQFAIPTKVVWESVFEPLGFGKDYGELSLSYERVRLSYEELRCTYEQLRNVHKCDEMHCNIWHIPPVPSNKRYHTCQKPVEILRRLIRVSSPPGGVVLDLFMGSGSTGVACREEERKFIGIEKDKKYYDIAWRRLHCGKFHTDKDCLTCKFGVDDDEAIYCVVK